MIGCWGTDLARPKTWQWTSGWVILTLLLKADVTQRGHNILVS